MVLRNSLLGADVAEHVQLLLVFSAHAFFLSVRAVETREFSGSTCVFPQPARGLARANEGRREFERKGPVLNSQRMWTAEKRRLLVQEVLLKYKVPNLRGAIKQALGARIAGLVRDYKPEPARDPRFISYRRIGSIGVWADKNPTTRRNHCM